MITSLKESKYIAGWEIDFDDEDNFTKILLTQGTDKAGLEIFKHIQTGLELIVKNKQIVEIIEHSIGVRESQKVKYKLPIEEWPIRKVFYLSKASDGTHSIGGEKPSEFILPKHDVLKSPFAYIGTIDGTDPLFSWMNISKLNLAYPIHEGIFNIFLDYEDPDKPIILNPEIFDYSWNENKIEPEINIQFLKQNYKKLEKIDISKIMENNDGFLLSGVPLWYQSPEIPICPKSGKVMQFVTTINSDKLITSVNQAIDSLPKSEYLCFGDYGFLYVFYEPTSKILNLNIQY